MINEVIKDCYGTILCTLIVVINLLINREKYGKKLFLLLLSTVVLALTEAIAGATERYLGCAPSYHPMRLVLSWACYIITPAILLFVAETILRDAKKWKKLIIAVPEVINIVVTSTAFFAPWCFSMNVETNHFQAGPLIIVPRYSIFVYLGIILVVAAINTRKSKWECVTVILIVLLIAFNYFDEVKLHILGDARELTIAISVLAYSFYFMSLHHIDEVTRINQTFHDSEEKKLKEMLDQSIETLAYTIDAKDRYTKGHSSRVAKYSRMIANVLGKSEEECRQIYLAGLLHDIGKISISGKIINKPGKLTPEEYETIKKHPANGALILEKMRSIPYLKDGANYHHERYDGKGYPSGLKGEEIPEIARIIAVADSYDAMTSYRSYRPVMEQINVKQEIWKGMGTQFDPLFAKIMISLIDADTCFDMCEKPDTPDEIIFDDENTRIVWPSFPPEQEAEIELLQETDLDTLAAFVCTEDKWAKPVGNAFVSEKPCEVHIHSTTFPDANYLWNAPAVIVYTSDNGKVLGPNYDELGVFMSAGYSWKGGSADYEYSSFTRKEAFESWDNWLEKNKKGMEYIVRAHREKREIILTVENELLIMEAHLFLSKKSSKNIHITVTGEKCVISEVTV